MSTNKAETEAREQQICKLCVYTKHAPIYILRQNHNLEFLFTLNIAGIRRLYSLRASHKNLCFQTRTEFCFSGYSHLGTSEFSSLSGMCKCPQFTHTALTPTF